MVLNIVFFFDFHYFFELPVRFFGLAKIIKKMGKFSGAEIKAVCTEAGYFAIRQNRSKISESDFLEGIIKVNRREQEEGKDYMNLFG